MKHGCKIEPAGTRWERAFDTLFFLAAYPVGTALEAVAWLARPFEPVVGEVLKLNRRMNGRCETCGGIPPAPGEPPDYTKCRCKAIADIMATPEVQRLVHRGGA